MLSQLKSGKWFGLALLHGNVENSLPICKVSSAENIWNWPISCLNDSETQERGLKVAKIQKKNTP